MNNCSPSIAIWRRERRAAGCPDCGGALHAANYRRKPRGRPTALGEEHDRRFSFCCSVDGCRDRSTPPSLRFLGRKVYLAVIVTLIAAMRDGVTERRLGKLATTVGVDRRTVARWRGWWLASFTCHAVLAGGVSRPDAAGRRLSPARRTAGTLRRRRRGATDRLLSFLGPITGGPSMQAF